MAFNSTLFWEDRNKYNREMRNLGRRGARKMKNNINEMQAIQTSELVEHVGYNTRSRDGEIFVVRWRTKRYGFIIEHGSGQGWIKGQQVHPNESIAPRVPKPWLSNAMDEILPDAANTIARLKGDDMVNYLDANMRQFLGQSNYRAG